MTDQPPGGKAPSMSDDLDVTRMLGIPPGMNPARADTLMRTLARVFWPSGPSPMEDEACRATADSMTSLCSCPPIEDLPDSDLGALLARVIERARAVDVPDDEEGDGVGWGLLREWLDVDVVLEMRVDGDPKSKARARLGQGRTYTPQATVTAEQALGWAARKHLPRGWRPDPDWQYGVIAVFFTANNQRRDVDNMLKLVLDGLTGVVWKDDSQVSEVSGRLLRNQEAPRTHLRVYRTKPMTPPTKPCGVCGNPIGVYASTTGRRRFCSRRCAALARSVIKQDKQCENCGREYRGPENSQACSQRCRSQLDRVTVACAHCGTAFSKPRSWVKAHSYCKPECRIAAAAARPRSTKPRPGWVCSDCGGPTTKKAYMRCKACSIKAQVTAARARPGYREGRLNRPADGGERP